VKFQTHVYLVKLFYLLWNF